MRGLSREGLAKRLRIFYNYQSYVHSNILGSVIVTLLILVPIHATYIFLGAPGLLIGGGQTGIVIGFTGLIYIFMIIYAVSVFTSDIIAGGGQLFLSQPVSRKIYVLTWMFVSLITPTFIFLASLVIPALIIEPKLLEAIGFRDLSLTVLEAFEVGSFLFLLALLIKRRGAILVLGIVLYFLMPWIILIVLSLLIYTFVAPTSVSTIPGWLVVIAKIYATLYPSKSNLITMGFHVNLDDAPIYSMLLSGTYILLSILYAHYRLEVK